MTPPTKAEELAWKYILSELNPSDYVDRAPDSLALQIFLAGWRARGIEDAKILEEKFHKISRHPIHSDKFNPDDAYSPFADAIRTLDSQEGEKETT